MMSETWSRDKGDAGGHKGPHTTQHHPAPTGQSYSRQGIANDSCYQR